MITTKEVELLAGIIAARAVVTEIEVIWINDLLNRLRVMAAEAEAAKLELQCQALGLVPDQSTPQD